MGRAPTCIVLNRSTDFVLCCKLPGKKDLFIEADLMSPLDRIANVTTLKVRAAPGHLMMCVNVGSLNILCDTWYNIQFPHM